MAFKVESEKQAIQLIAKLTNQIFISSNHNLDAHLHFYPNNENTSDITIMAAFPLILRDSKDNNITGNTVVEAVQNLCNAASGTNSHCRIILNSAKKSVFCTFNISDKGEFEINRIIYTEKNDKEDA